MPSLPFPSGPAGIGAAFTAAQHAAAKDLTPALVAAGWDMDLWLDAEWADEILVFGPARGPLYWTLHRMPVGEAVVLTEMPEGDVTAASDVVIPTFERALEILRAAMEGAA